MVENTNYSILIFVIAIVAVPLWCIGFGIARRAPVVWKIGIGIVCLYALLVLSYMVMVEPGQSGIVQQGTSPTGREYCIVQTYKGLIEPYQVSFYIRDASGTWRRTTLAHQDTAWNSAIVTFSDGVAHVTRDGRPYRDIPLPTNIVDLAKIQSGYQNDYSPSNFTPADILSFHHKEFKDN